MNFTDLADDPEDSQHTPAERMAAAIAKERETAPGAAVAAE